MILVQVAGLLVVSAVLATAAAVALFAPLRRLGVNREAVSIAVGVILALVFVAVDWSVYGRFEDVWRIVGVVGFGFLCAWYGSQLWERWRERRADGRSSSR